jgi:hypothetical protein
LIYYDADRGADADSNPGQDAHVHARSPW